MGKELLRILIAAALAATASAARTPDTWDGLAKVKARSLDAAYLLPGASFAGYSKVMIDPTEVAFQRNWLRDYNNSSIDLEARMSNKDAQQILDQARTGFEAIFAKAYQDAGVAVTTTPGPDVLRLRTAIVDLKVAAPDRMTAGMSRTYSVDAGEATIVIEARDSISGALLGRAADRRTVGDNMPYRRTSVSNRADFERLFSEWAKASVKGFEELRASPPAPGTPAAR